MKASDNDDVILYNHCHRMKTRVGWTLAPKVNKITTDLPGFHTHTYSMGYDYHLSFIRKGEKRPDKIAQKTTLKPVLVFSWY